jgi:hypothetical protein
MLFFILKRFAFFHVLQDNSLIVGLPNCDYLNLNISMLPNKGTRWWSCYEDSVFLSKLAVIDTVIKLESMHGDRLDRFMQSCGRMLRVLDLSAGFRLDQSDFNRMPGKKDLRNGHLLMITAQCTLLEQINFSNNIFIGDKGMVAVAKGNPNLTHVICSFCGNLSDVLIVALSVSCLRLSCVDFQRFAGDTSNTLITDSGLTHLALGCVNLVSVNVLNNRLATKLSVETFVECCKDLQYVYVSNLVGESWSSKEGYF